MRQARPLVRRPWGEVLLSEADHPQELLVCDACGAALSVLTYCGVVLCVPCWRKKSRRDLKRVLLTLAQARKAELPRWAPFRLRFVTLTVRNGPDLEERVALLLASWARLRARSFWSSRTRGAIAKLEVTWSPDYGYHPHLAIIQEGRYLAQEELSDEWAAATRGGGYIVDVRAVRGLEEGDFLGAAQELAKYVVKPTAPLSSGNEGAPEGPPPRNARDEVLEDVAEGAAPSRRVELPLQDWPRPVRSELARLLMGGQRRRWWCPTHASSSLERCLLLQVDPGPGVKRAACEGGAFREELVGFRRLRWYGSLREAHRLARDYEEDLEARCRTCGVGTLRAPSWFASRAWELYRLEEWEALQPRLHSIQGHISGFGLPARAAEGPRGALQMGLEGGWDPG